MVYLDVRATPQKILGFEIGLKFLILGRSPNIFVDDSINIPILELGRSPNIFVDDSNIFLLLIFGA